MFFLNYIYIDILGTIIFFKIYKCHVKCAIFDLIYCLYMMLKNEVWNRVVDTDRNCKYFDYSVIIDWDKWIIKGWSYSCGQELLIFLLFMILILSECNLPFRILLKIWVGGLTKFGHILNQLFIFNFIRWSSLASIIQ